MSEKITTGENEARAFMNAAFGNFQGHIDGSPAMRAHLDAFTTEDSVDMERWHCSRKRLDEIAAHLEIVAMALRNIKTVE